MTVAAACGCSGVSLPWLDDRTECDRIGHFVFGQHLFTRLDQGETLIEDTYRLINTLQRGIN